MFDIDTTLPQNKHSRWNANQYFIHSNNVEWKFFILYFRNFFYSHEIKYCYSTVQYYAIAHFSLILSYCLLLTILLTILLLSYCEKIHYIVYISIDELELLICVNVIICENVFCNFIEINNNDYISLLSETSVRLWLIDINDNNEVLT